MQKNIATDRAANSCHRNITNDNWLDEITILQQIYRVETMVVGRREKASRFN